MENLEYKGYFGSIEYSEGDNCFYGKIVGMERDCVTYEGESAGELVKDFRGAIDMYLEHCQRKGIEPEKSHKSVLSIRIPSKIQSMVALYAENHGTNIDAFICDTIEKRLETAY